MAFFQLFAINALADDEKVKEFDYSLQTRLVSPIDNIKLISNDETFKLVKKDPESPTYKRLNWETGEYHTISIFDYENINSHQYGASQKVFADHFRQLIKDPIIWDEMQKYYPVKDFDSKDEAMFFYEKYFYLIYDCGCGYAAAANFVFSMFEGREEEFYDTFGYPMYKIENNVLDFNYEIFMLKFFNYSVLERYKLGNKVKKSMERDLYEYKLNHLSKTVKVKKPTREEIAKWTDDDWKAFYAKGHKHDGEYEKIKEKLQKSTNEYFNFGIAVDNKFGYLYKYLEKFGIRLKTSIKNGLGKANADDLIASNGFTLTRTDENGNVYESNKYDYHYVYVTEINTDGLVIVSSWGDMYIFNNKGASYTKRVTLKMSK